MLRRRKPRWGLCAYSGIALPTTVPRSVTDKNPRPIRAYHRDYLDTMAGCISAQPGDLPAFVAGDDTQRNPSPAFPVTCKSAWLLP